MFKYTVAAAAIALSTTAFASDLPNRKQAPAAPTPVRTEDGAFFGVRGGAVKEDYTVGGVVGYSFNRMAAVEVNYDYIDNSNKDNRSNVVTTNVVGSVPLGPVTAYTLAGVGYRWADVKDEYVWNVGGGLRYGVTKNIDVDGRYRYLANFDNNRSANIFTVGVNYKF